VLLTRCGVSLMRARRDVPSRTGHPKSASIDPIDISAERAGAAAGAAGMVLTARAENHVHGVDDLEDTITRLCAFRDAGAHCLYAPGLASIVDIQRIVTEVGAGQRPAHARWAFRVPIGECWRTESLNRGCTRPRWICDPWRPRFGVARCPRIPIAIRQRPPGSQARPSSLKQRITSWIEA
jgi:hypothetical protein